MDKIDMICVGLVANALLEKERRTQIHKELEKFQKEEARRQRTRRLEKSDLQKCRFCHREKLELEDPGMEWTYHTVIHSVSCPQCYEHGEKLSRTRLVRDG